VFGRCEKLKKLLKENGILFFHIAKYLSEKTRTFTTGMRLSGTRIPRERGYSNS
jgi:hypothetical protein